MKTLAIALKDLLRSFRNLMFLAFGLILPLVTTALFYFAFGGVSSGDGDLQIARTRVVIVNLDQPQEAYNNFSAGEMLIQFMTSDELADLLEVERLLVADPGQARSAVDRREVDVAVIVPQGFTAAAFEPDGQSSIEIYHDPTLTLGPRIVEDIVTSFVDTFAGSKMAAEVANSHLLEQGVTVDEDLLQDIAAGYADWAVGLREDQERGRIPLLTVRAPAGTEAGNTGSAAGVVGLVMAGMMVFYVFVTGATSAQSILQEEEAGTLSRLFTTPTSQAAILGGKFLAALILLIVQVGVLVLLSSLIFNIDWGAPSLVLLVTLALAVVATGFGIFITSLLQSTRQAGIIFGGVMTVLGMVGMIGVFTVGVPGASRSINTVSLLVPQGWGVRAWWVLMEGGGLPEVLLPVAVMLALGVAFFVVGVLKFRERFA